MFIILDNNINENSDIRFHLNEESNPVVQYID